MARTRKRITIGILDKQIEYLRPVTTMGALNQEIITWDVLGCAWASITFKSTGGTEINMGDQHISQQRAHFLVRWRSDLDAKYAVRYNGKIYDIQYINEVGRKEHLEIVTELRQ